MFNSPNKSVGVINGVPDFPADGNDYVFQGDNTWKVLPPPLGKNLIINGAMNVCQRPNVPTTASNDYLVDRWEQVGVMSSGQIQMSYSTDSPAEFGNSVKLNTTTAGSISGTDYHRIQQKIEGLNLQHLRWGYSNPKKLTLSFWVKSNVVGNHKVALKPANGSVNATSYEVTTASAWNKKTVTFEDNVTAPFANDNTNQLMLMFYADKLVDNVGNYMFITGVQLEVGDEATEFEHEDYGTTLAKCQRYCEVIGKTERVMWLALVNDSTNVVGHTNWSVSKRSVPVVSFRNPAGDAVTNDGNAITINTKYNTPINSTSYTAYSVTTFNFSIMANHGGHSSAVIGEACRVGIRGDGTRGFYILADAEL